MIGGNPYSHLHGRIFNSNGRISGNNISYIYPDMETSFVGKFDNRVMKEARHARVSELKCDDNGIPYVSKFSDESLDAIFYYDPPSNISFGAGPERVRDPFDNKMVRLGPSGIPNSGDGVFLRKDVRKYSLVSSYLGYVYNDEQRNIYRRHCSMNVSKTDDERRHCGKYTISINLLNKTIDIPPEIDMNPEAFFPSLGPKVNNIESSHEFHMKLYMYSVPTKNEHILIRTMF